MFEGVAKMTSNFI